MPNDRNVIMLPTYAHVVSYRAQCARAGASASFGAEVTTFSAWVTGLWELFGDGRSIATRTELGVAVEIASGQVLSAGMVDLVARIAEAASGLDEFEAALADGGDGLSSEERAVLSYVVAARSVLDRMGAVDLGCAAAQLADSFALRSDMPRIADHIRLHAHPVASFLQVRFLDALVRAGAINGFDVVEAPTDIARAVAVEHAPSIRFAFPSGRYAEPRLLADIVESGAQKGRVIVCAHDPLATYEAIAPECARAGLRCAVRGRKRFADTDFGRAWRALYRCVHEPDATVTDLTDFLLSPFSEVPTAQAQRIDVQMRGDRRMTVVDCLVQLQAQFDAIARFVDVVSDIEADVLLGALEDAARRIPGVSSAYRREQLGALAALRDAMAAVRRACVAAGGGSVLGAMAVCEREMQRATVDASRETLPCAASASLREGCEEAAPSEGWDVLVASLDDATTIEPQTCAMAIACDMTSAAYPAVPKGDAADVLLRKIGVPGSATVGTSSGPLPARVWPASDALACQRAAVCALAALPTSVLVIERCLFDADAEPTYPAAVVQELVDCFRDDPTAIDDIDNRFSLPSRFRWDVLQRGEDMLYENAAVSHSSQGVAAVVDALPFGHVSAANRDRIVLPREGSGGRIVREPCLSPSQIESYLECPYKWFAQRRLRLDELDEGFGPIEMGDYAHHTFERFYRTFWEETGARKVTRDTVDQARAIMRVLLAEPNDHLVPITELENRDLAALKRRIASFLDFEVQLLPGFHPEYLEFDIPQDAHVPYAGHGILGRIDRIDVDDRGHAVIVDYKSSVSADYDLHAKDADFPRKVQALVYAQALKRMTGLSVVGAIYVSYGRVPQVSGAFDPDAIARGELPAMNHDACQASAERGETFEGVLDATEARVASALDRMLEGDVAPNPLTDASCTWCPVLSCPQRRG